MSEKFYLTTAIYYVNDVPHLGHALEVIGADIQARYQRMIGKDVMFLTGTDEHGQKVASFAEKNNSTPKEWVDRLSGRFQEVFAELGISYDDFIRTSEPRHHAAVQKLWKIIEEKGDIYLGQYEGWYDQKEESFITETEMKEQGLEPDGVRIKRMSEPAYFFRLSKYRDALIDLYEKQPELIAPDYRRNEVVNSFLQGDIPDLCISRTSIDWGIPVPGKEGHVVYVWFDALINYLTGVGYGWDDAKYEKNWPADVHVIGKDIVKFHCVYWPAFLMAADIPVARRVFAHGFINVLQEGADQAAPMSKSAGNVVDPLDYVKVLGREPLRYLLMRNMNYGGDGVFNEKEMITHYNAELPDGIGNLLSRTAGMIAKHFGEITPVAPEEMTEIEREFVAEWEKLVHEYEAGMADFEYYNVLVKVAAFRDLLNRRINEVEPWKLAKDPEQKDRLRVFLSSVAEGIRGIASLYRPFMPESSEAMLRALGIEPNQDWTVVRQWGQAFERAAVTKPAPLFEKKEADSA